ncbi:MAG: hypothetical protein R3B47_21495 [Bacteroidia bacterium]
MILRTPISFSPLRAVWLLIPVMYIGSWLWLGNARLDLLTGDAAGYYQYLPAFFIHGELKDPRKSAALQRSYFSDSPPLIEGELPRHPTGNYIAEDRMVIKYTTGLAIMEAPFFLLGHATAAISGSALDGYSYPYRWWVSLSKWLYALMGLWLLGKALSTMFDELVVAITLLLVALGTQLLFFSTIHQTMAHPGLFALYAALIWASQRWYSLEKTGRRSLQYALGIGLFAGFISLIRPTEIICLLIPLGYGLGSRARFSRLKQKWREILAAIAAFALCGLPQLLYWKFVSGDWLYYSYGDESFDFQNPQIWNGLFSYKNGWLVYSPVMVFALIGMLFMLVKKTGKQAKESISAWLIPIILIIPIHIYISYSWWCWNYINGFGSRPMVEAAALLSIPLAVTIAVIMKSRIGEFMVALAGSLLIALNLFQSWQFQQGILFSEDATRAYYWEIMGTVRLEKADLLAFDTNTFHVDPEGFSLDRQLVFHGFEDSLNAHFVKAPAYEGNLAYRLDAGHQYGNFTAAIVAEEAGLAQDDWLKLSVMAWQQPGFRPTYEMAMLVVSVNRADSLICTQSVRINNKIGGPPWDLWGNKAEQWDEVFFLFQLNNLQPKDVVKVYCWNPYPHPVYLDNLAVWKMKD